jgi:hypothetical protein
MKILLDIDDTALISNDSGKTYKEHPRLQELISKHTVFLFSGNPDIEKYYIKWKTKGFIPKGGFDFPTADVLIDNNDDLHILEVDVKESFPSIDAFFNKHP